MSLDGRLRRLETDQSPAGDHGTLVADLAQWFKTAEASGFPAERLAALPKGRYPTAADTIIAALIQAGI